MRLYCERPDFFRLEMFNVSGVIKAILFCLFLEFIKNSEKRPIFPLDIH